MLEVPHKDLLEQEADRSTRLDAQLLCDLLPLSAPAIGTSPDCFASVSFTAHTHKHTLLETQSQTLGHTDKRTLSSSGRSQTRSRPLASTLAVNAL